MRTTTGEFCRHLPSRARRVAGPWIDGLARTLGQPSNRVRRAEYVGTVHLSVDELEAELRTGGFTWAPMSLYHRTPSGTSTDGSWTYRSSRFADRQLHVVLFAQSPERVDVYAHSEYNWLRHPIGHVERRDIRREEGSEEMRRWLDARGLDYDHELVVRRRAVHLLEHVRERLSDGDTPRR